jgi:hypothetical protein
VEGGGNDWKAVGVSGRIGPGLEEGPPIVAGVSGSSRPGPELSISID